MTAQRRRRAADPETWDGSPHVINLAVAPGITPPSANVEPTGPPMSFPPQPPPPDGIVAHREKDLRARALECAVHTYMSWPDDTTDFTVEHAAELNIQLADRYLAYINGDRQP